MIIEFYLGGTDDILKNIPKINENEINEILSADYGKIEYLRRICGETVYVAIEMIKVYDEIKKTAEKIKKEVNNNELNSLWETIKTFINKEIQASALSPLEERMNLIGIDAKKKTNSRITSIKDEYYENLLMKINSVRKSSIARTIWNKIKVLEKEREITSLIQKIDGSKEIDTTTIKTLLIDMFFKVCICKIIYRVTAAIIKWNQDYYYCESLTGIHHNPPSNLSELHHPFILYYLSRANKLIYYDGKNVFDFEFIYKNIDVDTLLRYVNDPRENLYNGLITYVRLAKEIDRVISSIGEDKLKDKGENLRKLYEKHKRAYLYRQYDGKNKSITNYMFNGADINIFFMEGLNENALTEIVLQLDNFKMEINNHNKEIEKNICGYIDIEANGKYGSERSYLNDLIKILSQEKMK